MKRFLSVLVVLCLAIPVVSASLLSLGFGVNALNDLYLGEDNPEALWNVDAYRLGMDVRAKVLIAEVTASTLYTPSDAGPGVFDGALTLGLAIDVFNLVHAGIGLGPSFGIDASDWTWSYGLSDDPQVSMDDAPFVYRAHADVRLGQLSVGMTYQVPCGYTMANANPLELIPDWHAARYGATVMYWII